MKQYEIAYAYPTSPTAKKYGKYDTGCYILRLTEAGEDDIDVSVHDSHEDAVAAAKLTTFVESSSSRKLPHK